MCKRSLPLICPNPPGYEPINSNAMSSGKMLTPAKIESLRRSLKLSLELMGVASTRDAAIARGATAAELQEIEAKMESLQAALKANDSRRRARAWNE